MLLDAYIPTGNGNNVWHDDVQYGVHHISDLNMYSVGISYRGIRDNEHLDFSKFKGSDHCGQYVYSAGRLTPSKCSLEFFLALGGD